MEVNMVYVGLAGLVVGCWIGILIGMRVHSKYMVDAKESRK